MPFSLAGQLAGRAPVVQADAPLGLVAENLRSSNGGVVAVLDRVVPDSTQNFERQARLVGIITQDDLSRASERVFAPLLEPVALNGSAPHEEDEQFNGSAPSVETSPLETLRELKARDVMRADVPFVPAQLSLANALMAFDRASLGALPVLDETGRYLGILTRADVMSALAGNVRPPVVGGMATPLGVWLTDGALEGGAPSVGLFLSGLGIAARFVLAQVAVYFVARAMNPEWGALALSGRLGFAAEGGNLLNTLFFALHALFFLLLFKVSPDSGVHAAEHQTVHALERGLPLTLDNVRKMPRAHPRCGTNLMAIAGLILVGVTHLPSISPDWILLVLLFTFLAWRSFGDALQTFFTTRPASDKQIQGGIKAAQELLGAYQAQPFAVSRSPLRLLNRGMLIAGAGAILGQFVFLTLFDWVAAWIQQGGI